MMLQPPLLPSVAGHCNTGHNVVLFLTQSCHLVVSESYVLLSLQMSICDTAFFAEVKILLPPIASTPASNCLHNSGHNAVLFVSRVQIFHPCYLFSPSALSANVSAMMNACMLSVLLETCR